VVVLPAPFGPSSALETRPCCARSDRAPFDGPGRSKPLGQARGSLEGPRKIAGLAHRGSENSACQCLGSARKLAVRGFRRVKSV
jgi:hypothetical protein